MPISVIEIVFEIGKPRSTMQKIVIETCMKQTWLFNVTGSTVPIFVIEILIKFFRTSMLILKSSST